MSSSADVLISGYLKLRSVLTHRFGVDDAEDLAQSSYEKAMNYCASQSINSPDKILFTIARNLNIDAFRKNKDYQLISLDDIDESVGTIPVIELNPERHLSASQTVEQLCNSLDSLPPRCREAFILCKFHNLSYDETAREMGISTTVVRKYLVQAMKECRKILTE
ncbi:MULTISPECIES: RNA polymerase sigma factor [unclassified Brenneria]|uniref:RNA polymerase sigma factor n=1 Tax=unclassified Brenneria TaxID=2634434 RepID=UPI0029C30CB5|nr:MULTISPECIES: RNA polymerase sigma factor [unclassified Brenneria]MDX5627133.1 RNA polymerase sigma factor [Brenneria sp. L3-3Z]MDX5693517.1 RNA polymerase sigma factor [Brenneria sp. L4-2C]